MKKILTAFLIVTTIIISSCGADRVPLSEEHKIYAGKWVSNDGNWVQIFNNGSGSLDVNNVSVTGGTTIFTDSSVEISFIGIGSTFAINKKPYEEGGQFKMKLGQDTYVKQ